MRWQLGDTFTTLAGKRVGIVTGVSPGFLAVHMPSGAEVAFATCLNCGRLQEEHANRKCLFDATAWEGWDG